MDSVYLERRRQLYNEITKELSDITEKLIRVNQNVRSTVNNDDVLTKYNKVWLEFTERLISTKQLGIAASYNKAPDDKFT